MISNVQAWQSAINQVNHRGDTFGTTYQPISTRVPVGIIRRSSRSMLPEILNSATYEIPQFLSDCGGVSMSLHGHEYH
jgi:hypothetical protein